MEEIMQYISTLGFPITAWLITFWYMMKSNTEHKDEVDKLSDAYNRMTDVMEAIKTILEIHSNGVDSKGN